MEPGWYNAQGDPPGTTRYWDGSRWVGEPVVTPTGGPSFGPSQSGYSQLASPGIRIGARVIDGILGLVLALVFLGAVFVDVFDAVDSLGPIASQDEINAAVEDVLAAASMRFFLAAAVAFAWDFLWVAFAGGTPGKLLLGIRVADVKNHNYPPGLAKAALRALNRLAGLLAIGGAALANAGSGIGGLIALVSLVLLFADKQHRTVMDYVAGTVVRRK